MTASVIRHSHYVAAPVWDDQLQANAGPGKWSSGRGESETYGKQRSAGRAADHPLASWLAAPTPSRVRVNAENQVAKAAAELEQGVLTLLRGDWFYKWRKEGDEPRKRWFWLDRKRWQLYWAKTNEYDHFMSGWIGLQDVTHIETEQVVHTIPGTTAPQVFHAIIVTTLKRRMILGTTKREKFDEWYTMLLRLTHRYRKERRMWMQKKKLHFPELY
ncbi:hypothetical protein DIPPA_51887 [Diplonema papillatum]|nr:hypothetical protein DIPPA_51887 [Diplonema papillatum]